MNYLPQAFSISTLLLSTGVLHLAAAETAVAQPLNTVLTTSVLLSQNDSEAFQYEDFDFWADQCLMLSRQQAYPEALAACEQAISLEPRRDNADIWSTRGNALFHLGQYTESIASYRRVVETSPNNSSAIAFQCAGLFQLNQYGDAIDTCEQALSIDGNWRSISPAFAWYYRGLGLRQLGRLETALTSFERATTLDPENVQSLAEYCETLTELERPIDLAANCIPQVAVTTDEENPSLVTERCGALPEVDRPTQLPINAGLQATVVCYERALAEHSQDITLWIQQGMALEQLGLYERAMAAYDRAIELNPTHAIALVHHCGVLNQLQNYEAALESCDRAFAVNPGLETWNAAYGLNQRSAALIGLGKYDEALAAANQAIEIEPRYAPAWNSRALSLWWLNQEGAVIAIDRAIARYSRATETLQSETFERTYADPPILIYRGHILALFNKGRILASLKLYQPAIQAYSQALQLYNHAVSRASVSPLDRVALSEIWANQAAAYLNENAFSQALDSTRQALTLNQNSFVAWYNRGLAFTIMDTPQFECALDAYQEAERLNPGNADVLTGQGIALQGLERRQEAIAQFDRVLSADPNNSLAQQWRETLIAELWSTPAEQGGQADAQQTQPPISRCRSGIRQ
jgi:tetratricopeptide (TPR) repeat protein